MPNEGPLSIRQTIKRIRQFPKELAGVIKPLDDKMLTVQVREDGWTIRQLVHHIADSHVNIFCRMRFVLTEVKTEIKPYNQDAWAALGDAQDGPVEDSLLLIKAVHNRSASLLEHIDESLFEKKAHHPEVGEVNLEYFVRALIFHGQHHLRKIRETIRREEAMQ